MMTNVSELKEKFSGGMTAEMATGIIVLGALVFLFFIKKGFRGVSVGGVSVGVS